MEETPGTLYEVLIGKTSATMVSRQRGRFPAGSVHGGLTETRIGMLPPHRPFWEARVYFKELKPNQPLLLTGTDSFTVKRKIQLAKCLLGLLLLLSVFGADLFFSVA